MVFVLKRASHLSEINVNTISVIDNNIEKLLYIYTYIYSVLILLLNCLEHNRLCRLRLNRKPTKTTNLSNNPCLTASIAKVTLRFSLNLWLVFIRHSPRIKILKCFFMGSLTASIMALKVWNVSFNSLFGRHICFVFGSLTSKNFVVKEQIII